MGDRDFLKWVVLRLGAFGRGGCLSDTGRRSFRCWAPSQLGLAPAPQILQMSPPVLQAPSRAALSLGASRDRSPPEPRSIGNRSTSPELDPALTMFLNNNDHNHNDNSSTSPLLRAKCFVPCTPSKCFEHLISFEPRSTQGGMLYCYSSHCTDVETEAHRGCDLTEAP